MNEIEKLTKEKYREFLAEQIEKADNWCGFCPPMRAEIKVEVMKFKLMCMEKLYKLDNYTERKACSGKCGGECDSCKHEK